MQDLNNNGNVILSCPGNIISRTALVYVIDNLLVLIDNYGNRMESRTKVQSIPTIIRIQQQFQSTFFVRKRKIRCVERTPFQRMLIMQKWMLKKTSHGKKIRTLISRTRQKRLQLTFMIFKQSQTHLESKTLKRMMIQLKSFQKFPIYQKKEEKKKETK